MESIDFIKNLAKENGKDIDKFKDILAILDNTDLEYEQFKRRIEKMNRENMKSTNSKNVLFFAAKVKENMDADYFFDLTFIRGFGYKKFVGKYVCLMANIFDKQNKEPFKHNAKILNEKGNIFELEFNQLILDIDQMNKFIGKCKKAKFQLLDNYFEDIYVDKNVMLSYKIISDMLEEKEFSRFSTKNILTTHTRDIIKEKLIKFNNINIYENTQQFHFAIKYEGSVLFRGFDNAFNFDKDKENLIIVSISFDENKKYLSKIREGILDINLTKDYHDGIFSIDYFYIFSSLDEQFFMINNLDTDISFKIEESDIVKTRQTKLKMSIPEDLFLKRYLNFY